VILWHHQNIQLDPLSTLWKFTTLHKFFERSPKAYKYVTCTRNSSEFFRTFIVLSSHKKTWPNTCKIIKDSYNFFKLYHFSLKERKTIFCTSKPSIVSQETMGLLICKVLWTQGKDIPEWFRNCKGIYKLVEISSSLLE